MSSQGSCVVVLLINYCRIGSGLERGSCHKEVMCIFKVWSDGGRSPASDDCSVGFVFRWRVNDNSSVPRFFRRYGPFFGRGQFSCLKNRFQALNTC